MMQRERFHRPWPALAAVLGLLLLGSPAVAKKKKKADTDAVVAGRVMNQQDELLTGVAITLVAAGAPELVQQAATDKKGEFRFDLNAREEGYVMRLEKAGYAPFEVPMTPTAGEEKNVDIRLLDEGTRIAQSAHAVYNAGAEAHKARDYETAKAKFLEAVEIDPSLVEAHLGLADVYLTQQSWAAAAAEAEQVLAAKPDGQQAQVIAYEAYRKLGDTAKVEALRGKLAADPKLAEQLAIQIYNEGARLTQTGDLTAAVAKFRAALELDPDLPQAFGGLATSYYNQEDWDGALAAAERLLELDPDSVLGRRIRYLVHDVLQSPEATASLEAFMEVSPEDAAYALYERADMEFRAGNVEAAKSALLKILERAPDMARAHFTLAKIYVSTDVAKAKEHFQRFIELAPDDPEVATAKEMLGYL